MFDAHSLSSDSRTGAEVEFDAEALAIAHEQAIEAMTEDQRLAISREVLAVVIRMKARAAGEPVGRYESLRGVFRAEADARARGAKPNVDIFTPIGRELPGEDLS